MTITAGQLEAVLAEQFAARGLVRTGAAARLLHVRRSVLVTHMQAGIVPAETVTHLGVAYYGVPRTEVARLHRLMWPSCVCAAGEQVEQ